MLSFLIERNYSFSNKTDRLEILLGDPTWRSYLEILLGDPTWRSYLEILLGDPTWITSNKCITNFLCSVELKSIDCQYFNILKPFFRRGGPKPRMNGWHKNENDLSVSARPTRTTANLQRSSRSSIWKEQGICIFTKKTCDRFCFFETLAVAFPAVN